MRNELLSLHPTSPKAFLEMVDSYAVHDAELNAQLDIFIETLREGELSVCVARHASQVLTCATDAVKLQQTASTAKAAAPAVSEVAETAARIQARGEEDRQKVWPRRFAVSGLRGVWC